MKRYKKELTLDRIVDKYKVFYFLSFSVSILLVLVVLGIIMYFLLTAVYYNNSEETIMHYTMLYEVDDGSAPTSIPNYPQVNNPSMAAVVFYIDEETNEIDEQYRIIGGENRKMHDALDEDFKIEAPVDSYILTQLNGFFYMSYITKIDNAKYAREGFTTYLKVYNNINGEIESRNRFITIFTIISSTIFVLSFGMGVIMMKAGTKPLKIFVKKQTDFVSDASHELRTPLAVVQSKIETILSQPDKKVYEISEDLAITLQEISRLTKLTNELLTLARNDKDNIKINYTMFDLHDAMKDICEPFIEIASLYNKKLTYEGVHCMVKLDKDMLKQIMIINIDNALKYTEEGDEIKVSLKTFKDEAIISIADTGIGLSDDAKQKVFDRFYRADKARSREKGGNGLGLSIAYTLVKLQKGDIRVEDNEPKGAKFVITFGKQKSLLENRLEGKIL